MEDKRKTGTKGENQAVSFLEANGYHILSQNFRSGRSEIDIIARLGETLVFIEVKTRKNNKFGYPESFVSEAQQERIHYASEDYIAKVGWKGQIRFDIIAILAGEEAEQIDHFEDAF